jgi:hypothetical protein
MKDSVLFSGLNRAVTKRQSVTALKYTYDFIAGKCMVWKIKPKTWHVVLNLTELIVTTNIVAMVFSLGWRDKMTQPVFHAFYAVFEREWGKEKGGGGKMRWEGVAWGGGEGWMRRDRCCLAIDPARIIDLSGNEVANGVHKPKFTTS